METRALYGVGGYARRQIVFPHPISSRPTQGLLPICHRFPIILNVRLKIL